ncbi:hypothetical protein K438DRAFT_1747463 [Mycena galopus ATCC 62051]|nr:hypothetical protein K438DRAFT_1747463 [Mycena galopus ATCC 62051]
MDGLGGPRGLGGEHCPSLSHPQHFLSLPPSSCRSFHISLYLPSLRAWTIFTTVLQNEKPGLPVTQALLGYLTNVITNARVFAWPTVLDYHVAFVQLRARDPYFTPEDWTSVSPTLHTIHLLTPSVLSARLPSALGPSPDRSARLAQICFAFNGAGCTATACFRRHICRICEAEGHTEKMCSGPPPAVV